jgi:hypothetical protein
LLTVDLSGGLRETEHLEDLVGPVGILCLVGAEEAQIAGSFMKMVGTGHLKIIILPIQGKGMGIRARSLWIQENQMTICGVGSLEIVMMMGLGKDLNLEGIIGILHHALILPKGNASEVLVAYLRMVILLLMVDGEMRLGKVPMIELALIHPMGIGLSTVG